jgi:hypothetical protein
MKRSILLGAWLAVAWLFVGQLRADDQTNTFERTAVRRDTSAALRLWDGNTAQEMEDYINQELQRNRSIKSDGLISIPNWTLSVKDAKKGHLTQPMVIYYNRDRNSEVEVEISAKEGAFRVDVEKGKLWLHLKGGTFSCSNGDRGSFDERTFEFDLPACQKTLPKD